MLQNSFISEIQSQRESTRLIFPHKTGTGWRKTDYDKAIDALHVFAPIYLAVKNGSLEQKQIQDSFFKGISDPITYRHSWKADRFWSVDAWDTYIKDGRSTNNGLVSEHVVPRSVALHHSLSQPTLEEALRELWNLSFACVITREEDQRLTKLNLKSKGYPSNPWLRYKEANIKILNVQHPPETFFLSPEEEQQLATIGILAEHKDNICQCKYCASIEKNVAS